MNNLLTLIIGIASAALTIHGLYLAFSASIVLGIIVLFLEPTPLIISLCYLFGGVNLAEEIVKLF
jgi:hypothetical protein